MLKLWFAAVGISGVLFHPVTAQESGPLLVTPNAASVSAGEFQRLVAGQWFDFQLQFNLAPDGYGGGTINYRFQRVAPAPPIGFSWPSDLNKADAPGQIELHDGQAIYTLTLPITESMVPGTWKLVDITLGRKIQKQVPIQGDIRFEIPQIPPVTLHVQAPASVRAGQRLSFKVTLAEYPKGLAQGCVPMLRGYLHQESPSGQPNQGESSVPVNDVELKPDQLSYELSGLFEPDLPTGPWQGEAFVSAFKTLPSIGRRHCRSPQNEGDIRFAFTVEPSKGLVTPTSVAVTVNPSQIQLLLAEANRLKAKAEHLRQQLNSENLAVNQVLLRNSVQEAITDLERTEEAYKQRGVDQSSARAVNMFFDDIRLNYGEALNALTKDSARGLQTKLRLELVSRITGGSSPRLGPGAQAVLASILRNAKAYDTVASSGSMTFTVDVYSDPQGASVSYRQRNGEYRALDHETDWRIENLIRGVWFIRLQKPGYEDTERTVDAMDIEHPSINVHLVRKRDVR